MKQNTFKSNVYQNYIREPVVPKEKPEVVPALGAVVVKGLTTAVDCICPKLKPPGCCILNWDYLFFFLEILKKNIFTWLFV